ncbi:MAG: amidohydrolase family protein, partial [Bacteroidota bacterium]
MRTLITLFLFTINLSVFAQVRPQNGVKESEPELIALKNATIYVTPERKISNATLLLRGERIAEVGSFVIIPEEALIIDCRDLVILPAFIETYSDIGLPKPEGSGYSTRAQTDSGKKGAYYWNETIHPEVHAADLFVTDSKAEEELMKMGFGTVVTHVQDGIMRGTGALVSLGEHTIAEKIINTHVAQFLSFEKGISKQSYPSSQMGAIALLRQVFHDARWHERSGGPITDLSLMELNRFDSVPFLFSSRDKWEIFRAKRIAEEFNRSFNYIGSGNEYAALDILNDLKDFIVLPLNFPEPYNVTDPYVARQIPLADLKHWELAPSNAHILKTKKVPFCFTSEGVKNAEIFWKNLHKTIERGLTVEEALAALTIHPAKLLKVDNELGTLEKGKLASFCIYSANPLENESVLHEVWTLGKQKVLKPIPLHDITGTYNLNLKGYMYPLVITDVGDKLQASISGSKSTRDERTGAVTKDSLSPKVFIQLLGDDLTLQFTLNDDHFSGNLSLHAKTRSKFGVFEGDALLPDGTLAQWSAIRNGEVESKKSDSPKQIDTLICDRLWFPNMAYGFDSKPSSEAIVIRDATVWTNEAEGVLKNANVIIQDGKITYVGSGSFALPEGARIIEASGKHLTTGIIDEHSHIAISRGVNEGGQAVSAEVRIGDVINPDDINIYRQLAGGVTAAQLLHGSANPIGGQSALIKLKWGVTPDEMLIDNAPKFIKCA